MVIGANGISYNIKADILQLQYKKSSHTQSAPIRNGYWADWISYNIGYKVLAIGADLHIDYNKTLVTGHWV